MSSKPPPPPTYGNIVSCVSLNNDPLLVPGDCQVKPCAVNPKTGEVSCSQRGDECRCGGVPKFAGNPTQDAFCLSQYDTWKEQFSCADPSLAAPVITVWNVSAAATQPVTTPSVTTSAQSQSPPTLASSTQPPQPITQSPAPQTINPTMVAVIVFGSIASLALLLIAYLLFRNNRARRLPISHLSESELQELSKNTTVSRQASSDSNHATPHVSSGSGSGSNAGRRNLMPTARQNVLVSSFAKRDDFFDDDSILTESIESSHYSLNTAEYNAAVITPGSVTTREFGAPPQLRQQPALINMRDRIPQIPPFGYEPPPPPANQ
ncbi:hypothetical protein BC830DRAFT_1169715 [Chytriomyces sp. MP71]|nr:hypothetical protein BC830DRAFT_1169715 [Chytriomyces sp. MP71]